MHFFHINLEQAISDERAYKIRKCNRPMCVNEYQNNIAYIISYVFVCMMDGKKEEKSII